VVQQNTGADKKAISKIRRNAPRRTPLLNLKKAHAERVQFLNLAQSLIWVETRATNSGNVLFWEASVNQQLSALSITIAGFAAQSERRKRIGDHRTG
jgi:hypothetical protein